MLFRMEARKEAQAASEMKTLLQNPEELMLRVETYHQHAIKLERMLDDMRQFSMTPVELAFCEGRLEQFKEFMPAGLRLESAGTPQQTLILRTEGIVGDIWDKIKAFFKAIWDTITGWFSGDDSSAGEVAKDPEVQEDIKLVQEEVKEAVAKKKPLEPEFVENPVKAARASKKKPSKKPDPKVTPAKIEPEKKPEPKASSSKNDTIVIGKDSTEDIKKKLETGKPPEVATIEHKNLGGLEKIIGMCDYKEAVDRLERCKHLFNSTDNAISPLMGSGISGSGGYAKYFADLKRAAAQQKGGIDTHTEPGDHGFIFFHNLTKYTVVASTDGIKVDIHTDSVEPVVSKTASMSFDQSMTLLRLAQDAVGTYAGFQDFMKSKFLPMVKKMDSEITNLQKKRPRTDEDKKERDDMVSTLRTYQALAVAVKDMCALGEKLTKFVDNRAAYMKVMVGAIAKK